MVQVTKATGLQEPFSEEKLRYSIHRAGIPDEIQTEVVAHVKEKLYEGIPTGEIYHHVKEFLTSTGKQHTRAKYGLKEALMELGPTGYPFEDYIAKILETQGYQTQTRQVLSGKCVTHEIDVLAEKDSQKIAVEAKFHNASGIRSDVHVALYTKARFDDLKVKNDIDQAWIITNTKATVDAMNFGECVGMRIISWNYPEGESLRDMIEKSGLSPITSLTGLTQAQKQELLIDHVVLCKDLTRDHLLKFGLSDEKIKNILGEAAYVSNT